jgi:alpha-tubulin suppressor-like RCC1 family protein
VRADGSVIAWGSNAAGQLGAGAALAGTNARQVATTALAVAAGATESLAVGADGIVRGWGRKLAGTTIIGGDAAASGTDQPSPATGGWPGGITHVVTGTGNAFGVGLRSDGTVWHMPGVATAIAGGLNQVARQVPGLTGISRLGAGVSGEPTAIGADGRVWRIAITALGAGNWQATATEVAGISGAVAAICNGFACIALDGAGAVRSFATGAAASGLVTGLPVVRQVAATGSGFLAVGQDGTLWRWNLGATPVQVAGLAGVVEAAGGLTATVLVRLADGTVWGYGSNSFGELGSGTPATSTPVQVPGIHLN